MAATNACKKFQYKPVSIMNFVEGTRFQPSKQQNNDFRHLLAPKSGGVALAISSLTPKLSQVLDVTVVYPQGRPTFFFNYWEEMSMKLFWILKRFLLRKT